MAGYVRIQRENSSVFLFFYPTCGAWFLWCVKKTTGREGRKGNAKGKCSGFDMAVSLDTRALDWTDMEMGLMDMEREQREKWRNLGVIYQEFLCCRCCCCQPTFFCYKHSVFFLQLGIAGRWGERWIRQRERHKVVGFFLVVVVAVVSFQHR